MKKTLSIVAILAVTATACNKEAVITPNNEEPAPKLKMVTETISGTRSSSTKVTIANSNGAFSWTVGDNLAVHVSHGDSHKYVFTSDSEHGALGASEAGESASFTVAYEEGFSRDAFAVFPSNLVAANAANYGQSDTPLEVTLPATYTLTQVSGENTPCPMIAANTPGNGWEFHQLCGLLRLTVNDIPSDATGLVIQFPGKKVNGSFSISAPVTPGTSTITTGVPTAEEDKITITFNAGLTEATVNIPLPTGTYDIVYITPIGSSSTVAEYLPIKTGGYTAAAAHAKKLAATLRSLTGKVMGANGRVYDDAAAATTAGTTAEAMIAYVGKIDGVCEHGLAISLTDAYEYNATYEQATGTYIIPNWELHHAVYGVTWRLPTEADWQYMMWGSYSAAPGTKSVGTVKNILVNDAYWTATETNSSEAYVVYYDGDSFASIMGREKTQYWHVRACLSF